MRAKTAVISVIWCALSMLFVTQAVMPALAAEERWKELRSLPFQENYPTKESADRLHDEMLFHRAPKWWVGQYPQ